MSRRSVFLSTVLISAGAISAQANPLREEALEYFRPLPSTIPALTNNAVTPAKIDLGKALFFDPRMSASGAPPT